MVKRILDTGCPALWRCCNSVGSSWRSLLALALLAAIRHHSVCSAGSASAGVVSGAMGPALVPARKAGGISGRTSARYREDARVRLCKRASCGFCKVASKRDRDMVLCVGLWGCKNRGYALWK